MGGRHFFGELGDRVRGAHARDHVFALGVDEIFAVENFLAARRVAGKSDAGRARIAHVAEDHRLDIDGRAPVVRESRICADKPLRGRYSRNRRRRRSNPKAGRARPAEMICRCAP